jgi:hypothetical protein
MWLNVSFVPPIPLTVIVASVSLPCPRNHAAFGIGLRHYTSPRLGCWTVAGARVASARPSVKALRFAPTPARRAAHCLD